MVEGMSIAPIAMFMVGRMIGIAVNGRARRKPSKAVAYAVFGIVFVQLALVSLLLRGAAAGLAAFAQVPIGVAFGIIWLRYRGT